MSLKSSKTENLAFPGLRSQKVEHTFYVDLSALVLIYVFKNTFQKMVGNSPVSTGNDFIDFFF